VIPVAEPESDRQNPIKVVPIYIDQLPPEVDEPEDPAPREPRPVTPFLGGVAVGVAVVAGVLQAAAVSTATGGDNGAATVLGWVSFGIAVLAVVGGVAAIVLDRGRRLGIIAMVAGLIANPLVLLGLFRLVGAGE
jgi:hypothetical protein